MAPERLSCLQPYILGELAAGTQREGRGRGPDPRAIRAGGEAKGSDDYGALQ